MSIPGWATLLLVGTVCAICLAEGIAAAVWSAVREEPLREIKIPEPLFQLATMGLGFYLGRKSARR